MGAAAGRASAPGPVSVASAKRRMIMKMRVAELWRYPVKSLAGEPLDSAEISAGGHPGRPRCSSVRHRGSDRHRAHRPTIARAEGHAGPDGRAPRERTPVDGARGGSVD